MPENLAGSAIRSTLEATSPRNPPKRRERPKKPKRTWTLEVTDKAKRDQGKLRSFSLALQR